MVNNLRTSNQFFTHRLSKNKQMSTTSFKGSGSGFGSIRKSSPGKGIGIPTVASTSASRAEDFISGTKPFNPMAKTGSSIFGSGAFKSSFRKANSVTRDQIDLNPTTEELCESVKVVVRCRPMNDKELHGNHQNVFALSGNTG